MTEHLKQGRVANEIAHGKLLAKGHTEAIWGWGSPAGQQRATKRAAKITSAAKLAPGQHVLEIGCGSGMFTRLFAASGAKITANDVSPDLIELAKKANPGVKFICAPFEDLPTTGRYDAVIGSSVLHHLDLDAALQKSIELLSPGGRLAFAEPNMLNPQIFAERTFLRDKLDYVSPDETAFVRWSLAKTLAEHGYVDIHITPFDWLHPAVPTGLIKPVEAIGRILEWLPGIREFSGSLLITCRTTEAK
ncbi:MAG: methyltransferase domain-containing protein [Anaerolineales bacterium]|nr:methyltransferase domain-containing protein [Anaerolineales bacterium]